MSARIQPAEAIEMRKKDRYEKIKDQVLDENLLNGPLENRSCQDMFCCLLWLCSLITLIALFCYGMSDGDPSKLVEVFDVDGNRCGKTTGYEDYKYLYYMVPIPKYLYRGICCPNWAYQQSTPSFIDCKTTTTQTNCDRKYPTSIGQIFDFSQLSTDMIDLTLHWDTTLLVYNTTSLCVPAAISELTSSTINDAVEKSLKTLQKWVADIENTWEIILSTAAFALIVGFIYMYLLRYFVGCMIWGAVFLYFAIIGIIGWVYYQWAIDKEKEAGQEAVNEDSIRTNKIIAYCVWGWAGLSFLIFCCYYHKIRLAIATATCYVADVKTTLLIPPINVIVVLIFWTLWVVGFLFIYTIAETEKSNDTSFSHTIRKEETNYCLIYYLIGGLWKNAFIMAVCQFVIGSSVCIWYFSKGQGQTCHKPISRSLYRAFRYHLGSLAFGSLILAIVQFVRLVLAYIQRQCEASKLSENKLVQCALKCASCLVACLERFIEFLNKNAYIQIALNGKSFCGAAKDAMCLIIQHAGRFAVVHGFGSVFIFLGKIFICAFATLGGYLIITRVDKYNDVLYSTFFPTLLMVILTYTIGSLFMAVYGMAVDAILHCFLLDEELAKKKGHTPAYTPEHLRDFLDSYAKKQQ